MAEIQFKCPQCGQMVEADKSYFGKVAMCPFCGKGVVVPHNAMPVSAMKQAGTPGRVPDEHERAQQLEAIGQHTRENAKNRTQSQGSDSSLVRMRRTNGDFTTRREMGKSGVRTGTRPSPSSVLAGDTQFVAPAVATVLYWILNIVTVSSCIIACVMDKNASIVIRLLVGLLGGILCLLFNRLWYEFAIAIFEGIRHLRQIRDELKAMR